VADLLIVGTGLMGTSVALAVRDERDVVLRDATPDRVSAAVARGAGRAWDGRERCSHVLLATPPAVLAAELLRLQRDGVGRTYGHLCSVQAGVQAEVEAVGADAASLCGSHPLAGSERSGPEAASAELFAGRPWVLCPSALTGGPALAAAGDLAAACGAEVVRLTAEQHDETVALVSHLPQVAASAVAARLLMHPAASGLAGPGLRDTTRVAASDPALWTDVLALNAAQVGPLVQLLADDLAELARALRVLAGAGARPSAAARGVVTDLLARGRSGRSLVPVKRGEHDRDFVRLAVRVPDRPGQLAGLLVSAAQAGINVEDVRVEHLPGRPTGVIELLVQRGGRDPLARALQGDGWDVVPTTL